MNDQQDHVASIQLSNSEEGNSGINSGTTRETINLVSDKLQRKSARAWILRWWYEISLLMCTIALALDPLFCYSLVINDDKKCLMVDKKLATTAIVLRSVMDFLYVIHVIFKFRNDFLLPRASGRVVVLKAAWAVTKSFLMDILSVLPLPQVVLLIIIYHVRDLGYLMATKSLILVVLLQYMPRVLRIYPLCKIVKRNSGILIGSPALNLFLYMLACHVVGAFWYLFAVERKTMCWQEACKKHIGCVHLSCDDILGDYTFLTDSCPIKAPNATIFDFGIFLGALDSGIVDSTDFLQKLSYSFWFGLQSVSSLGQNLNPSIYIWEIFFAVIITILGLSLFVFVIGNMQTYLQFRTVRLEKMRLKGQEIDLWMAFHLLPRNLKKNIKEYQQCKWREIRGVDNLLHNLPKDIRRDTMRHLCLAVLMKVPMLQNMDRQLLDAICDHLKHVFYIEHSCIVRQGDPLDEMLFITRGTLLLYSGNGESNGSKSTGFLEKGDSYGEELLNWALYSPSLSNIPFSTKTVHAHTKVEAFALMANDLKNIVSKFTRHFDIMLRQSPGSDLEQWERRVATTTLATYRRRKKQAARERAARERAAREQAASERNEFTISLETDSVDVREIYKSGKYHSV